MPQPNATPKAPPSASRRFQVILLVIAGALIVAGAMFSARTLGKLRDSVQWVTHTMSVIEAVKELNSASHDVDTFGLRYLLAANEGHLRAHSMAISTVAERLDRLAALVSDNPSQIERVERLRAVMDARDEWFRRAIGEAQVLGNGADAPQVLQGGGAVLTGEIRILLLSIEGEENRLLRQRQALLEGMLTQGAVTVVLVNGLALVMAIIALALLRRGNQEEQARRVIEARAVEAERATRQKSEFLATMSHEIRTPMNALLGFSQLLGRTRIEPQAQEYLRAIRTSGEALLALINDILDLSRIEAGKLSLSPQMVEIRDLVDSTVGVFSEAANRKGLVLRVRTRPEVPRALLTDPHRLRQILMNLVSNAVKYTDQGEVDLLVEVIGRSGARADLRFSVRDTGRGIPEAQQAQLFEPFHRAVADEERESGTGLGLAIVRRLTDLLGGKVDVQSTPGEGSTFTVTLLGAEIGDRANASGSRFGAGVGFDRLAPSRILIVDDVAWNRDLLQAFLSEGDHQLEFASNGQEAVDKATEFRPDLILMDLRMPILDGREATRRLRERMEPDPPTVIAISASSMSREERELGKVFDGYVRKPVDREVLYQALVEHLGEREEPEPADTGSAPDLPPPAPLIEGAEALDERMIAELREMLETSLPRLRSTLRVAEVGRFAARLMELGESHQAPSLAYFGERLRGAVERFDIAQMESLLHQGEEHLNSVLNEVK
ncbi:ATP-binding protein [Pseudomarimonas salicorniae]|uniref:histidine kinase n=1 Tax=Pseudomarimonas salicorniae TaxID=2933270 RepID=A0ABT0GFD0_9GAMM|nr:ATP-binding protein [Lysobacter sp. CAU 1642]MCK7593255.1 ATP-binding protein [Lysobacter sp. CAU 1642]